MTAELRRELIGEMPQTGTVDWESISLWNPDWKIKSEVHGDAPTKLPQLAGRQNVLMTHPFRHQSGATIERNITVPSGKTTQLHFNVAAREKGKWVLRVFAQARLIHKELIDTAAWKPITIDLTEFAGQEIKVQLENFAYDLQNDYAYWNDLRVISN